MNAHVSDELPGLLSGEAPRDVVLEAAAHLRTCVDCQQELVSAVVAHASLTSAQRFAPEVVATPLVGADDERTPTPPLPDLSEVFARARAEAASPRRLTSRRSRILTGVAAAAVVIGGGTAALVATAGDDAGPATRTVQLAAYDQGTADARATIGDGEMRIDATSLPTLPGKGYEVWLTDSGRTTMKPVGWIGSDGTATLSIPASLMTHYSDIEVSLQDMDAPDYDYSDVSVLRGPYA